MKKNDKIIVIFGVIILVLAGMGIYYWEYEETTEETAKINEFYNIAGVMKDMPEAIAVSDTCKFYPLIATPVAVNYDSEGEQNIIPLYIKNFEDTSSAVVRAEEQIGITVDEIIKDSISSKNASLEFAKKYWKSSKGVLIIEDSQSGYNLGVLATPFASYLSIPVIVTDKMDLEVKDVLDDLGVESSIVCGNVEGFGNVLRFNNPDDIINASIELVSEKFEDINYVTVTNPIDAYEPEVLDSVNYSFSKEVTGFNLLPSRVVASVKDLSANPYMGSFTIPEHYKYALIKFEGIGEYKGKEDPDEFGSVVSFTVDGPAEIFGSGLNTGGGGIAVRDDSGKLKIDRVYTETVVYDLGGSEFHLSGSTHLFVTDSAHATVNIEIQKLSDPLYPMMKKLSSMAPYLTAYRKGIIFGKPEFAFVADDDIRTEKDENMPGYYGVRMNHGLQTPSNRRVIEVHDQINGLLAKLVDIDINKDGSLKALKDYYEINPIYIALVGGNVVLPQIIYDNYLLPAGGGYLSEKYGIGIPSDVIYGNIDPIPGDFSNTANDVYTDTPIQENIVGRITGWDSQDASALIARTIFYDNIIRDLGEWKEKATVQTGCGTDFLKPLFLSLIRTIVGKPDNIVKWPSGQTAITGDALQKATLEPIGFDVLRTYYTESQVKGFSDYALKTIQKTNLVSRLLFAPNIVRKITGENTVKGGQYMEESNVIWQNAHGWPNGYEAGDVMTNTIGWRPPFHFLFNMIGRTGAIAFIATVMTNLGSHDTRNVADMELGPSVMIIESCFCGKIDGMYPEQAISQTPLHAGVNALIASTTESNVPGGYMDPYMTRGLKWDRWNWVGIIINKLNARKGIYPEPHFGHIIYEDFFKDLGRDKDVGTALRNARNGYLPKDWDATFTWVPPLNPEKDAAGTLIPSAAGGSGIVLEHKYMAYYEYTLYGDPAFNPYTPSD